MAKPTTTPTTKPTHVPMAQFAIRDEQLMVDGHTLAEIARELGQTPFYVYDKSLVNHRISKLRALLPKEIQLHYAIKANPMQELIDYMAGLVDGFDVASVGELQRALAGSMPAARISFAGPGKGFEELETAINVGVLINVESRHELDTIAQLCEQHGKTAKIALRVNPDFELKGSGLRMGGGAKQFGIDAEQIPGVLQHMRELGLALQGFHIFSGSQSLNAQAVIDAQEQTFALAERLARHWPEPIRVLNIGGGFGIPYFPGDPVLNIDQIGEYLHRKMQTVIATFPEADIVLELGRYLVGEAGLYVCRVLDKKISRGKTFLITDGGLHQHLAASGNLGQVIRKNYPVAIGNKMGLNNTETVNVVGRLCMPLDILAEKVDLPETEIGDLVVIYQSGAYGLSASPGGFLTHPAALEILI